MKLFLDVSARVLAIVWAGFWLYFFLAESLATAAPISAALAWVGVGLVFVVLAVVPWRWEQTGALLLIAAGVLLLFAYVIWAPTRLSSGTRAITTLTFAVPPLLAGMLFLLHRRAVPHHHAMRHSHLRK